MDEIQESTYQETRRGLEEGMKILSGKSKELMSWLVDVKEGDGGVTIRKEKDIPVTEIMGQKKTQSFDVRKCGIGLLEQRMKESGIAYDMSAVKEPDGNELVRVTFLTKDADKVTEALSGFADDLLHGKAPKEKPSVEKQVKENMKKAERTRKRRPGKKMTRGVR